MSITSIAGKTFPSISFMLAPPPVDKWSILLATPLDLMALTLSPPPTMEYAPLLATALAILIFDKSNVDFGAQNISEEEKGALTGEISASMIKDLGATYTIIGLFTAFNFCNKSHGI